MLSQAKAQPAAMHRAVATSAVQPITIATIASSKRTSSMERSACFPRKATTSSRQVKISQYRLSVIASEVTSEATAEETEEAAPRKVVKRRSNKPQREVTVQPDEVVAGKTFKGSVTTTTAYGAFVNFGAKNDGLVHISELSEGYVENVQDIVQAGAEVEVRVLSVDPSNGRVALSMKKDQDVSGKGSGVAVGEDGRPMRGKVATRKKGPKKEGAAPSAPSVRKGEKYTATVKTLQPFGAFVELKEGVEGLVHVSEISEDRVSNPEDVLEIGQEVQVRVLSVDGNRISLSMKEEIDLAAANAEAIEAMGSSLSPMELALLKAGIARDQYREAADTPVAEAVAEETASAAEAVVEETEPEPVVEAAPAAIAEEPAAEAQTEEAAAPAISAKMVKELRDKSGAGMMDCKKALKECEGDIEAASEWLRKKGIASAEKKSSRIAAEGAVGSYIHAGSRIGVVIEINCETDFVARGDRFQELVADMAMQVAANPLVDMVSVDDADAEWVAKEKAIEMGKEDLASKPENIREKMVEGRISKAIKEKALLEQPFIKDTEKTVNDVITTMTAEIGEKISIRRFIRYNLGEGLEKRTEDFAAEVAAQTAKKEEAPKVEEPKAEEPKVEEPKEEKPAIKISASLVKELRGLSGAGMMDCKKALAENDGDLQEAADWLRKKGISKADKKASRIAAEGAVGSYIHAGSRIGVLIEINCETDFVARGDIFKGIVEDMAMQVAANPTVQMVAPEDVDEAWLAKEKEIEMGKEDLASKPENIREKMVEGRLAKLVKEQSLLEQPYIKDPSKTVGEFIKENIASIGEKVSIRRFTRYNLGEGIEKRNEDFAAEVAAQMGK